MSVSKSSRSIVRRSGQGRSQSQFDFNRAAKLAMLDRIVIPAEVLETHREKIGSARGLLMKVKALLRSIDSFAREDSECFASVKKIGEQVGSSERTTQRYLKIAKLLGLITVINGRHHTTNIHDINWSLVLEWSRPSMDTNEGRQQRDEGRQQHSSGATTTPLRGDNPVTQIAINRQESQIKTPSKRDGVLRSSGEGDKSQPPDGGTQCCGGWPMTVTADTLNSLTQLGILWEHALANAWVTESDRLRFLTLACYCRRRELDGALKSAGATFTSLLRKRKWFGDANDEERARIAGREIGEAVLAANLTPTAQPPPTHSSNQQKRTDTSRQ